MRIRVMKFMKWIVGHDVVKTAI